MDIGLVNYGPTSLMSVLDLVSIDLMSYMMDGP